jgi:hypothetical protein
VAARPGCPAGGLRHRMVYLASQDCHLVPEHDDFASEVRVAVTGKGGSAGDADRKSVTY